MKKAVPVLLLFLTMMAGQTRPRLEEYAVVLEDAPVARKIQSRAFASAEARAHLARIYNAQAGVLAELKRRSVAVTGATQVLVNAVMVSATRETAVELRAISGVSYVVRVPRIRMDLDRAVALQNVSAAWGAVGGASNAGAGIKIGIIDSGIDRSHPGFQDPSLRPPTGFPKGETAYTNSKIIVARSYVSEVAKGFTADPTETSRPDDYTPRDRVGHGTAIAMIAAGSANTGPAGTIQGIAPQAFLGNYKIFGSPGVNDGSKFAAFNQALQDALADGMDIVTLSMSEGNPAFFGPLDAESSCGGNCDVYSQAVESAIAGGLVVVVSAGNSGNIGKRSETLTSIHFPGTAPSAITVGASSNSHALYQTLRASGFQNIRGIISDGPHVALPPAPIRDVNSMACSALPAGSLAGAIALIQRGACSFTDKIVNAQNAGAVGVVIYQSSGQENVYSSLYVQSTGIPSMMIGNSDGLALKNYLAATSNATASFDAAIIAVEAAPNAVWPSSSRGPSPGSFAITQTYTVKPELVAIGAGVYTATQKLDPNGDLYNASGYTGVTGTSYAVPMVAGAAALVKQKFPQMTPAQIKSAVVNTATQDVSDASGVARVNSAGAGKLNAGDAVNVAATLDPATISFGAIAQGALPISRTLRIANVGASTATFNLAVQQRDVDSSASLQVIPASVTLNAGQSDTVTVRLQGTRPAAGSYEGFIVVTGAGPTLRLPYQYLVGNGVPADVFSIGGDFVGGVEDTGWEIDLRVVDSFGVPVVGTPLRFNVVSGGGKITAGDQQSFRLGNAAAIVTLGPSQGDQIFNATVGGLTIQFDEFARNYPDFKLEGVLNAASQVRHGLAPGSYISIYGTDLADATQVESTASLPVSLSTVSVSFDAEGIGQPGHLHFVSPGQVNVQIPWEFQGKSSVAVKVTIGGLQSYVVNVPLATYSPGIFEIAGLAAVQDANFVLVNQAHPAVRGQAIQIYVNGLGPVSNQPASGEPSPGPPLAATAATPTVSIGGIPAQVIFSGMTPGVVGLYQINAIVPPNVPTGAQPLTLSIGGVDAKASMLPVQ